MNWKIRNIILLLFVALIYSCTEEQPTKSIPVSRDKDAVLIYMASDNNLYTYAQRNIGVMETLYNEGSSKQILIYVDATNGMDAKLVRIINTPKGEQSRSEVLKTYKKPNSSDPKVFEGVINDAQAAIGNNRISDLVLWSHGKAWLPYKYTPLINGAVQYSFGVDDSANRSEMNIDQLAGVLSKYKFDNIIFDACYMSNIEVLYQLRNSASYIVSSPAEVLADGFAYSVITPILTEEKLDPVKLAKTYFGFYDSKSGSSRSATVSVVECSKLEPFAAEVKKVVDKYADRIDNNNLRTKVGQYDRNSNNEYYYDLKTYISQIITSYATPADKYAELASFDASFDSFVIYEAHTPYMLQELSFEGTYGVSGYIPGDESWKYNNNSYFRTLDWADASGLSNELFY